MVNREAFLHMPMEMLSIILEQLPNPVFAVQDDHSVLYANLAARSVLGLRRGEILTERDGLLLHPSWQDATCLARDAGIQDIFRIRLGDAAYLCFQKYVPDEGDKSIFSIVSVQEESQGYDLYFDCKKEGTAGGEGEDERFLSRSVQMEPVLKMCARCAPSDLPILFLGESGSGKTMLAEYVHRHSRRRSGPFLVLNCAAIARDLLESELFGYAPYAFTNASSKGKKGLFELADGGTLLLDEIGDMPMELQAKILTAVETQSILPIGGREYRSVNVRVLAATNKDLAQLVRQGAFRQDLLWRLNTVEVRLPPLRERPDDILYIADHFRSVYNDLNGTDLRFTPELMLFLQSYDWPGNVRQLKNTVEKMLFLSRDTQIPLSAARGLFGSRPERTGAATYAERIEERERRFIQSQYRRYPSTRKLAAALKVSQTTATRLIRKYVSQEDDTAGAFAAVASHTRQENAQGRLTQQQLYTILDSIPNRVCVVDQDLVCIAEKYRDSASAAFAASPTTAMYRSGYKLASVKQRPIVLEYVTTTGKQRQSIIAPIRDEEGNSVLYASITQIHFSQETIRRRREVCRRKSRLHVGGRDFLFFGASPEMRLFLQDAVRSGWQDLSVLIQGESGTGKSVFARYIHELGSRRGGPFVCVNCASIPENLVESELFGYEKGAFTGASPQGKEGLFQLADRGTLFLDEIGDLPLPAQAKLLDVIENKRFIPIGGSKVIFSDVRVICATNQDLKELIRLKKFREDLYWRINVIELTVPPLRARGDDIERYAEFFLKQCNIRCGTEKRFAPEVISLFLLYSWPGNLRQLANLIERSHIMSDGEVIRPEDLPEEFQITQDPASLLQYSVLQRKWDREIFSDALQRYGSAQEAAAALAVSSATVSRKRAKI
ncbi:hypothetical protein CE91St43_02860 [Oscillospiraceae bacterium]|nr:hypothetical protein CE91St43_02860 [Oscillospiraceae bacterium]